MTDSSGLPEELEAELAKKIQAVERTVIAEHCLEKQVPWSSYIDLRERIIFHRGKANSAQFSSFFDKKSLLFGSIGSIWLHFLWEKAGQPCQPRVGRSLGVFPHSQTANHKLTMEVSSWLKTIGLVPLASRKKNFPQKR